MSLGYNSDHLSQLSDLIGTEYTVSAFRFFHISEGLKSCLEGVTPSFTSFPLLIPTKHSARIESNSTSMQLSFWSLSVACMPFQINSVVSY